MSNGVSDFGKNVLGMSEQDIKALNVISSMIGTISSIWGSFNTLKSVLDALGLLPKPTDEIAQLRQAVDQLWQNFQVVIEGLEAEQSMRAVAHELSLARNELQNLQEFAPEDASATGIDPVWDGLRPFALDNSSEAVIELGHPAYWQRVYFDELVYHPPWQPYLPYQDDWVRYIPGDVVGGRVFDWRLTLPAYLEAISIRLTILAAVAKDYSVKFKSELNTIAVTLEDYFNQINSHIKEVWPYEDASQGDPYQIWTDSGSNFGAVELYSGLSVIDHWSGPTPSGASVVGDKGKFLIRFLVRVLARRKQLYNKIGLASAAATLKQIKLLAGIVPPAVSGPTGDWSARELAQRLAALNSLESASGIDPARLSSLHYMLDILQTFSPQPYTSLRAALAQ